MGKILNSTFGMVQNKMGKRWILILMAGMLAGIVGCSAQADGDNKTAQLQATAQTKLQQRQLPDPVPRFSYDSGFDFKRPKNVRGLYLTANTAGGSSKLKHILDLQDHSDLNSVVIDIKDDYGNVTFKPDKDAPFAKSGKKIISDPKKLLKKLEDHNIYPIARIVVFKDNVLSEKNPKYSFRKPNGDVWKNGGGSKFVNPFMKEVWDYNVNVAIAAAKMGFKEIQFDYVRFPEGFEKRAGTLKYDVGDYGKYKKDTAVKQRVNSVTDFVQYAREKLKPYGVDTSVDIFGYTATLPAAPGIGQNMSKISENVDVISSMIYPSHWTSYFGIQYPDLHPHKIVSEYAKREKKKLSKLDDPPISRPWIQDFTASWLGSGHYQKYGKKQVEAQISALNKHGIHEFLVWDANNNYTSGVDYTPSE